MRCLFLFAGIFPVLAPRVSAQLAANSPFMPAQAAATTAVTEGAPLELRGVMNTGSELMFGIFDPAKKVSVWSKLNEKDHDFLVKSYDAANETVTLQHGGRTLTLAMRAARVASSGQASAPPPMMQAPVGMPNAISQSVTLNPSPADEQRRLEAVAAEVRRRRSLREQASIQAAQGLPVVEAPVAAPVPQPEAQRTQRTQTQGQKQTRTRQ